MRLGDGPATIDRSAIHQVASGVVKVHCAPAWRRQNLELCSQG